MSRGSIEDAAFRCFEGYGVLGISVEAAIDMSVVEVCRTSRRLARHRKLRLSTFSRLRTEGFALVATFEHPHFTFTLPDLCEVTLARVDRRFDDPIPNPGRPAAG